MQVFRVLSLFAMGEIAFGGEENKGLRIFQKCLPRLKVSICLTSFFLFAIPYEYIYQQGPDDDKVLPLTSEELLIIHSGLSCLD